MTVLLLVAVFGGLAARRRKGSEAPRDWWTVAGLFTWRPLRRWRTVAVAVVLVLWLHLFGVAVLLALAVLGAGWWPAERDRIRALRAADRYVAACVAVRCQDSARWFDSPYPLPKHAELKGSNVVLLDVRLPAGLDVARLAEFDTRIASRLDVAQVQTVAHPDRGAGWAHVWITPDNVRARRPLPVVTAPDVEPLIELGDGLHGTVTWDLDEEVGLAVYGAPGAGKGRLARLLALQWLDDRYGRRLTVVDLQGSAEWVPLARHPRCTVLRFDPRDPVGSLGAVAGELARIRDEGAARMDLCSAYGVDRWADLPADVRDLHPRSLLLVDEVTNGLGKPPAADKSDHATLIRDVGSQLGKLYRTVRKNGWQTCHVDQLTYADTTTLPPGSTAMFGRWVALGGFGPDAREQISGTRAWPDDRAQAGLGVTARRGAAHIDVLGVPSVDRQAVTDTLDLAALPALDSPARQDPAPT